MSACFVQICHPLRCIAAYVLLEKRCLCVMLRTVQSEFGEGGREGGIHWVGVCCLFYRVYCTPCIEKLCGPSEVERVSGPCTYIHVHAWHCTELDVYMLGAKYGSDYPRSKSEVRADNPPIVLSNARTFAPRSAQQIRGSRRQSSDGTYTFAQIIFRCRPCMSKTRGAAQKRGTALEFHPSPVITAHLWVLQLSRVGADLGCL